MRTATYVLATAVLLLICGQLQAAVLVSPVIIDACQVKAGTEFVITLTNIKPESQIVYLDWGWFSLHTDGTVELDTAVDIAVNYLDAVSTYCSLDPGASRKITVKVINQDFTAITPVLFLSLTKDQIQSRLAVLFVLSTAVADQPLQVEQVYRSESGWQIRAVNPNSAHVFFTGTAEIYQAGEVVDRIPLGRYLLLANSKRDIPLPANQAADRIVVRSAQLRNDLVVLP